MAKAFGTRLRIGMSLILKHLGVDLYSGPHHYLWEVVRNGLDACMLDPAVWDPSRAHVEISIIANHPLSPEAACLMVLDHGSGFTEAKMTDFTKLGDDESELIASKPSHGGSSQKRIGKICAFLLNRESETNYDAPIYLVSRTSSNGDAIFVRTSLVMFRDGTSEMRTIKADDKILGPYRNIKGSFSLFIIPNTRLTEHSEVVDDLKWRVPRIGSKNVMLTVNGKRVVPPNLAKHNYTFDNITAYIDKCKDAASAESGIWICDAESGLRCAHAPSISNYLPYPISSTLLKGDIFIPGMLSKQDTGREKLSPNYLKTTEWRAIMDVLRLHLVQPANELIGNLDNCDANTQLGRNLHSFHDLCNKTWGEGREGTTKGGGGGGGGSGSNGGKPKPIPPPDQDPPETRTRKGKAIKIGDHDYFFSSEPRPSEPDVFGILDVPDESKDAPRRIRLNPNYAVLKRLKGHANFEHFLSRVLELVAVSIESGRAHNRHKIVSKLRLAILDHN